MRPVVLPVFHHTDETSILQKIKMQYALTDCHVREGTFYEISAVFPYTDPKDNSIYTEIASGNQGYIVALPPDEVNKRILNVNPEYAIEIVFIGLNPDATAEIN